MRRESCDIMMICKLIVSLSACNLDSDRYARTSTLVKKIHQQKFQLAHHFKISFWSVLVIM